MARMLARTHPKIAIVGAGSVGATIAYACLIRGVARHFAIYDIDRKKVDAEVLDLVHGVQFVSRAAIDGSDDVAVCADASIVIITAGAKQKPGQTRIDLAAANAKMCQAIVPKVLAVAPDALLLLVTNPVDVLTYITHKISGLPRERVLGSGTVLDSSRFRFLIARHCDVAVHNVHAYIVGEHGDSEIPLWSSATIANIPLHEWAVPGHGTLSAQDRAEIFFDVKNAAAHIIAGKGATNYAVGLATARIVEALVHDEDCVLPVSSLLNGYRPLGSAEGADISDVCLSVPCIVNRRGVEQSLALPMNEVEVAGLKNSAAAITSVVRELGF
jgi:L-lactate dehydrogenase